MANTNQTTLRLIAIPQVCEQIAVKKTTLYELVKAGELHPIKIGRKTVFSEAEIQAWIADRIAVSRKAA